jgi:hypothetical protein
MMSVLIDVRNAAAYFDVVGRSVSIQQAVGIVVAYYPSANVQVRFPLRRNPVRG